MTLMPPLGLQSCAFINDLGDGATNTVLWKLAIYYAADVFYVNSSPALVLPYTVSDPPYLTRQNQEQPADYDTRVQLSFCQPNTTCSLL
jgi:hypothetical protein